MGLYATSWGRSSGLTVICGKTSRDFSGESDDDAGVGGILVRNDRKGQRLLPAMGIVEHPARTVIQERSSSTLVVELVEASSGVNALPLYARSHCIHVTKALFE